jgi:hypothetical protein
MTVRSGAREIAMQVQFHPPHGIHVRRLRMAYQGWLLETNDGGRIVTAAAGSTASLDLEHTVLAIGGYMAFSNGSSGSMCWAGR